MTGAAERHCVVRAALALARKASLIRKASLNWNASAVLLIPTRPTHEPTCMTGGATSHYIEDISTSSISL